MIIKASQHHLPQILILNSKIINFMQLMGFSHWNEKYPNEVIYRRDIMRNSQYVYLIDEKVKGIVSFDVQHHENFNSINWDSENKTSYFVHRLAVDPEFQGQGIANQLMDYAESFAKSKKIDSIRLGAFKKYSEVVRFYSKRSYTIRGEVLFDVSETPFLGMEKKL